jgi:CRP-like cAMP-binding protein
MNLDIYKKYEQHVVKAGTELFRENDSADGMYVIVRGRISISKQVMTGLDKTLTVLEDGEYFGEMSLLLNKNRSATATTLEDTTLIKLSRNDFRQLLKEFPEVGMAILTQLAQRLEKATRESILLALELALAEQRPPQYTLPPGSQGQLIVATGSFDLKDMSDVLQRTKELQWGTQTNILVNLLQPGQGEDSLIYVIQTHDIREIMKLTSCFKDMVRWKISLAISTDDTLADTFV